MTEPRFPLHMKAMKTGVFLGNFNEFDIWLAHWDGELQFILHFEQTNYNELGMSSLNVSLIRLAVESNRSIHEVWETALKLAIEQGYLDKDE